MRGQKIVVSTRTFRSSLSDPPNPPSRPAQTPTVWYSVQGLRQIQTRILIFSRWFLRNHHADMNLLLNVSRFRLCVASPSFWPWWRQLIWVGFFLFWRVQENIKRSMGSDRLRNVVLHLKNQIIIVFVWCELFCNEAQGGFIRNSR